MSNPTQSRSQNIQRRQIAVFGVFVACLSALTPHTSLAGGVWIEPTYITRIGLDPSGLAFIQVSPKLPNTIPGYAAPACATIPDWQGVFNAATPVGQAFLSVAISARLARTPVRFIGSGACTLHSQVETLSNLDILPN